MSDEAKNGPQLGIGLINEILSERIFIRVIHAPWRFFHLAAILVLCRNAKFRSDTLYNIEEITLSGIITKRKCGEKISK
jgi:hypothetical protein